ncbi:hypothetical protein ACXHCL_004261, partial [Shigella flexneri]
NKYNQQVSLVWRLTFASIHLPYFRKIQQEIFNGSERTAVRGGGTDAKKPTGEAGFFAIPDRSW